MQHRKSARLIAGLCATAGLFAGLSSSPAQADGWVKAQSPNFIVYSDTDERTTRQYDKQLEYFHFLTQQLLNDGVDTSEEEAPFVVYLLKNSDDLKTLRADFPATVAGVYFNCSDAVSAYSTIFKSNPDYERRGQDESQLILFHEYTHYIMYHYEHQLYPSWYSEGIADYLGTTVFGSDTVTIGQINGWRSETLKRDGAWTDFADILTPQPLGKDGKPKEIDIFDFYAESWVLTHYMLSDPARNKALRQYFQRVANGEDPVASFELSTGIKIKDLQGILRKYMAHMPYSEMKISSLPEPQIAIAHLDKTKSRYLLLGSALKTCPEDAYSKTLLMRLETLQGTLGDDGDYQMTLAEARVKFGDPASAEAFLKQRIAAKANDFDANYLLGRLYYRQQLDIPKTDDASKKAANALMDKARGWFAKAYAIAPDNSPNLFYLAHSMADMAGFPTQSALNAADGALVGAPTVYDYAEYDAYLNLLHNDRDLAVGILMPFANDPHSTKQSKRVREAVSAIQQKKTPDEIMAILSARDPDEVKGKDGKDGKKKKS